MDLKEIQWVRFPSIDISWLSKHEKQLPLPKLAYVEDLSVSGIYVSPCDKEIFFENILIPPSNGTIVICADESIATIESTIAHEWRHHWQQWRGWEYDGIGWDTEYTEEDYWDNLKKYFTSSKSEKDALFFERKLTPSEWGDIVFRHCFG